MKIEEILRQKGPLLSGELSQILIKVNMVSPENARQLISRAKEPVKKLKLGFDSNQSFLYLETEKDSHKYFNKLIIYLKPYAKVYYYLIHFAKRNNGYVNINNLPIYSSSPILRLTGHKKATDIIKDLIDVKIFQKYTEANILILNDNIYQDFDFNQFKIKDEMAQNITAHLIKRFENTNFIAFGKAKTYSSDEPEFGKMQWCFTVPTYLNGMTKPSKGKIIPGFIIGDVILNKSLKEPDIEFFLKKVSILKAQINLPNFIPILVTQFLEPEAFKKLKKNGVYICLTQEIFGDKYFKFIKDILDLISNPEKEPGNILKILNDEETSGKFGNMKGDLFEYLVGNYYNIMQKIYRVGKKIRERKTGKDKEIDILVNDTLEVIVIECKALNAPLSKDFVNKWLTDNIFIIRKWILDQDEYKSKNIRFELWSVNGFEQDALNELINFSNTTKKYNIAYLDKADIKTRIGSAKDQKLNESFIKHYA